MNPEYTYGYFNAFDLLLVVTLGFSMIMGFARGFVREFLGLFAWAGAVWVTTRGYMWPSVFFSPWITEPAILKLISSLSVFCLSLVVFLFLVQWLSYSIQNSMAQSVDRSLGIVFGLVRGFCIVCGAYIGSLFFMLPQVQPPIIQLSKSYPLLNKGALFFAPLLPQALQKQEPFQKSMQELKSALLGAQELSKKLSAPRP